ncbi:hypothetical protein [Haliovirga abyssi]|uniref:Uncharacterized protein n=1 Tax=Haliovirga abyssi TaxID=2996794 RepID=A0AAU9DDU4_9FUSO|nr:hypothetical protein [Haliovirga abyssi]BDU49477.1 hypothetical protein HLVA_00460 [Haliovirga abyssi]
MERDLLIKTIIEKANNLNDSETIKKFYNNEFNDYYKINYQTLKSEPKIYSLITISKLNRGGRSRKIKNISINLGDTITALVGFISGGIGSTLDNQYGIFFNIFSGVSVLLTAISTINKTIDLKIGVKEGITMWVLHCLKYKQSPEIKGDLTVDNIFLNVNMLLKKYDMNDLKMGDLELILDNLKLMNCVEKSNNNWIPCEIVILETPK